jgi:exodeoxyribonuclease VII large subunit
MDKNDSTTDLPQLSLPLEPLEIPDWRKTVPSVSELTRRIRGQLENTFGDIWVRGEISNFRKPVSGHAYFVLKDASAQLKAVMFRGSLAKLKFNLQDGMEVLLHGKIAVYEPRGEYQIIGDTLEPVGVGALQLAFEQLKMKLAKEGLFDPKHKKPIPKLPRRIGIVTSPTGAAVKDILKVLSRRFPNREILILPANVQGEKAAGEIAAAISLAEKWNSSKPERAIDVLIVGRGGGSIEDLWPFNEEVVARAIYACPIPIISAVGHEIDVTISDFVADLRAPTPSAAAEIVVPLKDELKKLVDFQTHRLVTTLKRSLDRTRLHLGHLTSRLVDPRQKIKNLQESFRFLRDKLMRAMRTQLLFSRKTLESRIQMLNTLSPLQVLARGFSLTSDTQGKIIRSVTSVQPGSRIVTRLTDGTLVSEVISE